MSLPPITYSTNPPREDSFPQENEIDNNGITFHSGYKWHVGSYGEVSLFIMFDIFIKMYSLFVYFIVFTSLQFVIHIIICTILSFMYSVRESATLDTKTE